MQHGTRKRLGRTVAGALALGIAAALALPGSAALALTAGGDVGGGGDGGIDRVDKPFGQIIRIIPDVGMSALLYLPALPIDPYYRDEETGRPALQALYVDRAYADDPDAWERWGTFEWDEDWQEYAWGTDSIFPVYDDDYEDPSILYCTVSYSSSIVDYRDFYLRATAVTLENGALTTTAFEPALIAYEEEWLPDPAPDPDEPDEPDAEPPSVVNPPEVDSGDGGGNRGGVGQGESERVNPGSAPADRNPSTERAETIPPQGDAGEGQGAEPRSGASGSEEDSVESAPTAPEDPTEGVAPAAGETREAPSGERLGASAPKRVEDEERIPGFVWAVGLTAGTAAVAGGALVARRRGSERPRKTRP